MNTKTARALGEQLAGLVEDDELSQALNLITPILSQRIRFPLLGLIGEAVGEGALEPANAFLDAVAASRSEGGWVIIGTALRAQLGRDRPGAFSRCRDYIIGADVWYAADILAERVPGPSLLESFHDSLALLLDWRNSANRWARRAVGVAAHFWAKRSRGEEAYAPLAQEALDFLSPLFEEWEMDAVKGVGWALKTLGKHYPDLMADWLAEQTGSLERRHRALMLRKALTYLSEDERRRATGENL